MNFCFSVKYSKTPTELLHRERVGSMCSGNVCPQLASSPKSASGISNFVPSSSVTSRSFTTFTSFIFFVFFRVSVLSITACSETFDDNKQGNIVTFFNSIQSQLSLKAEHLGLIVQSRIELTQEKVYFNCVVRFLYFLNLKLHKT